MVQSDNATGPYHQENFGPNVASFVNEEHVSMATTSGLHQAPLGEVR